MPGLATVTERHDVTRSNSRVKPKYEQEWQAFLLKSQETAVENAVARRLAYNNIVSKARTAIVGKNVEKGGANGMNVSTHAQHIL